jgi:NIL domain
MRRLVHCTLPPDLVHQPILHDLVRATSAVVNVRRANVDVESGVAWFLLELTGPEDQVELAEAWLAGQGVAVEPIDA